MFLLVVGALCALSLIGSAIFYFGTVSAWSYGLALLVVLIGSALVWQRRNRSAAGSPTPPSLPLGRGGVVALIGCIVSLGAWWSVIWGVRVIDSIRSPWLVVAPVSIIALGLGIFFLYGLIVSGGRKRSTIGLILLLLFSGVSMAAIVYPLGFGFDPFLHRATIAHIAEFGTISPKPLYYIGQYSLELFGHLIFKFPIELIDRWLLPLFGSTLLVGSAWIGLSQTLQTKKSPAILAIFLFPLSALIVTTPQSLAFVTTTALIFLSLPRLAKRTEAPSWSVLGLLTATTLAIHPLAGIPAVIYFTLVCLTEIKITWLRRVLITLGSLASSIALPLVFMLQAKTSGLPINFTLAHLFDWSGLGLTSFFANHYNTWFDGLYLVIDNLLWMLMVLAVLSLLVMRRVLVRSDLNWTLYLPLLTAGICFANFLLMSLTLEFDFLIEYERADYAGRLLTLTMIFLLPGVAMLLHSIDDRLASEAPGMRVAFAGLLAVVIMANIYGAYPRHDNYARSAGFNVAQNDFDAVRAISIAGGEADYIVLANQAVSAAAVETYGFKKYYHGDIFYYPIPTGGVMYEYFLAMNEAPSRDVINQALDAAGTDLAFFVVNDYWWQSEKTIENTKNLADDWFAVGEVTVFKFSRATSDSLPR